MPNSSSLTNTFPDPYCQSTFRSWILISYNIVRFILLLPTSCLILHRGLQQWRKKRSLSKESHSDIFAYNVACLELFRDLGFTLHMCSLLAGSSEIMGVVHFVYWATFLGENIFHVLRCFERYLAVVCPHTYMRLRHERGVRIRNISVGCSWLLPFTLGNVNHFPHAELLQVLLSFGTLIFSSVSVSLCSLSVLCVLFRPGPGQRGRSRGPVDQTKHRAVLTIMAIWGVLLVWLLGLLLSYGVHFSSALSQDVSCQMVSWSYWSSLPGSLLLPLLYLQRAGVLSLCCRGRH